MFASEMAAMADALGQVPAEPSGTSNSRPLEYHMSETMHFE